MERGRETEIQTACGSVEMEILRKNRRARRPKPARERHSHASPASCGASSEPEHLWLSYLSDVSTQVSNGRDTLPVPGTALKSPPMTTGT